MTANGILTDAMRREQEHHQLRTRRWGRSGYGPIKRWIKTQWNTDTDEPMINGAWWRKVRLYRRKCFIRDFLLMALYCHRCGRALHSGDYVYKPWANMSRQADRHNVICLDCVHDIPLTPCDGHEFKKCTNFNEIRRCRKCNELQYPEDF